MHFKKSCWYRPCDLYVGEEVACVVGKAGGRDTDVNLWSHLNVREELFRRHVCKM